MSGGCLKPYIIIVSTTGQSITGLDKNYRGNHGIYIYINLISESVNPYTAGGSFCHYKMM